MSDKVKSRVAEIQAKFIAEVKERGIVHALEWIDGWYAKVAEAAIQDEASHSFDPELSSSNMEERKCLRDYYLKLQLNWAERVSNKSTSQGANMATEAKVAVLAKLVNRLH